MGAYDNGIYKRGMNATGDPRLQAALTAFRIELSYNGFGKNLVLDSVGFGEAMENRVKEFQASRGLKADGQIGVKTSTELFRRRVVSGEAQYNLPAGSLGKLFLLESAYDPVAIGYADPADHGIAQINLDIHSDVSVEEAFDPIFAIDWSARYLRASFDEVAKASDVMKAARAAYNVGPTYAAQWLQDGFPTSGKVVGTTDWYKRATDYIALVDKQTW